MAPDYSSSAGRIGAGGRRRSCAGARGRCVGERDGGFLSAAAQRHCACLREPPPRRCDLGVPGGIEALVLEWSDPDRIAVTVGWTRVADADSAAAFAAAVRATKRSSEGLTAIGPALLAAAAAFDHMPEPAARRIIDISGDGMANFGLPPSGGARPSRRGGDLDQRARDPHRGAVARGVLPQQRHRRPRRLCRRRAGFPQLRRRDAAQTRAGDRRRCTQRLRCSKSGSARSR